MLESVWPGVIYEVACTKTGGEASLKNAVSRGQVRVYGKPGLEMYFFPKYNMGKRRVWSATEQHSRTDATSNDAFEDTAAAFESFLGGDEFADLLGPTGSSSHSDIGTNLRGIGSGVNERPEPIVPIVNFETLDELKKQTVNVDKALKLAKACQDKVDTLPSSAKEGRFMNAVTSLTETLEVGAVLQFRLSYTLQFKKTPDAAVLDRKLAEDLIGQAKKLCCDLIGDMRFVRSYFPAPPK